MIWMAGDWPQKSSKNTKKDLRHRLFFILVEGSWLSLFQPIGCWRGPRKTFVFFRPGVAPTTHWLGFQFGFSTPGTVGREFGFTEWTWIMESWIVGMWRCTQSEVLSRSLSLSLSCSSLKNPWSNATVLWNFSDPWPEEALTCKTSRSKDVRPDGQLCEGCICISLDRIRQNQRSVERSCWLL